MPFPYNRCCAILDKKSDNNGIFEGTLKNKQQKIQMRCHKLAPKGAVFQAVKCGDKDEICKQIKF